MEEEKAEFPRAPGAGSTGTQVGYSVEARHVGTEPRMVNGLILDKEWRGVHFDKSKCGVPGGGGTCSELLPACGLYPYDTAQALRWWFCAEANHRDHRPMGFLGGLQVETRIVKHHIKYEYRATAVEALDVVEDSLHWRE